jgi:TRAP-type C4-dicarboxylate transport system permease small subunit
VTEITIAGILRRLERWGTAIENGSLVVLLAAMMLLAVSQIALRIFFSSGFVWAEELMKLMVLWIALIASIAASRNDRHLRIDLLSHYVSARYTRFPRMVVDLFAAGMCGFLAWQSWRYVQLSIEFEETVLVDIPAAIVHGIAPVAFGLMCYRFFLLAMRALFAVFASSNEKPNAVSGGS